MLLAIKVLVYSSFLVIPLLLMNLGNQQSIRLKSITNNWIQNFKSNIVLKRDESFISRADKIEIKKDYYTFKNNLIYYNKFGEISFQIKLDKDNFFSASSNYYLLYKKVGNEISFFSMNGEKNWSLKTFSYPYLSPLNNMILLISTDNSSISIYDINKNLLLPRIYLGSFITDFKFSNFDGSLLLGTLEGKLFFFNYLGELQFSKILNTSRFNYIKTVSISNESNYFLVINGLQPEYLTLIQNDGKILWQKNTLVERKNLTFPFIDEKKSNIYDLRNEKIYILNLKNGKLKKTIDLAYLNFNMVDYALFNSNQEYFGIILNSSNKRTLLIFNSNFENIWEKHFLEDFFIHIELSPISTIDSSFDILLHSNQGIYSYHIK